MFINFNYHGSTYKADLSKQDENNLIVRLGNTELEQKFGPYLSFKVSDKTVSFNTLNRSHSDLFALNCCITQAINEQLRQYL